MSNPAVLDCFVNVHVPTVNIWLNIYIKAAQLHIEM